MDVKIVGVVLVVVLVYVMLNSSKTVSVVSTVDGKAYRVLPREDAQQAADMLARLHAKIVSFMAGAEKLAGGDHRIDNVRQRWSGTLKEIDGSNNIAYSTSKKDISICVRDKTGKIDDLDNSTFVLLHEIAHIADSSWGHTPEYWNTFKFILELAEKVGVYRYANFEKTPVTYCGLEINNSPLTCVKDGTCESAIKDLKPRADEDMEFSGPLRPPQTHYAIKNVLEKRNEM